MGALELLVVDRVEAKGELSGGGQQGQRKAPRLGSCERVLAASMHAWQRQSNLYAQVKSLGGER